MEPWTFWISVVLMTIGIVIVPYWVGLFYISVFDKKGKSELNTYGTYWVVGALIVVFISLITIMITIFLLSV